MNCEQAKGLIDLRVHESLGESRGESVKDAPELDAHVAACPRCRAEFEELLRVRGQLTTLAGDRPSDAEKNGMWTGVLKAMAMEKTTQSPSGSVLHWWARNRAMVFSLTGVAAVLALAFQIGNLQYGGGGSGGISGAMYSISGGVDSSDQYFGEVQSGVNEESGGELLERRADGPSSVRKNRLSPTGSDFKAVGTAGGEYTGGAAKPTALAPPPMPGVILGESQVHAALNADDANEPLPNGLVVRGTTAFSGMTPGTSPSLAAPNAVTVPPLAAAAREAPPTPLAVSTFRWMAEKAIDEKAEDAGGAERARTFSRAGWERERDANNDVPVANDDNEFFSGGVALNNGPSPRPVPQNLKIIRTGELSLECDLFSTAAERIERIVAEKGGFVANATSSEETGGAIVGTIVVRVPPERFDETFAALKAVGRIESENVKAADVTADYVDTEARIASLQITEQRLRELIANKSFVDKIASLLEVERELNRVRTQIESYQGQLRVMADRVSLATITVTIREPRRIVPSASLSVEVASLDVAAKALGETLASTGGKLLSGKTSKRGDGTLMGNYQIETNVARFGEVAGAIEGLGRVEERQIKDQQFGVAGEPWAEKVKCAIALVLFERSRQLPNASVGVEIDDLDSAMERLTAMLANHDATISSSQTRIAPDGADAADIRLRVPAGRFASMLDALDELGRMTSKATTGETENIVGGAAAVPCDITLSLSEKPREVPSGTMAVEVAAFDAARDALSRQIAERKVQVLASSSSQRGDGTWLGHFRLGVTARDMEAFVSALEKLGRVQDRHITGLGLGDLSRIDPTALGVIELTLAEKASLAPAPDEGSGSIRARIREGLRGFYSSIGLIAYGLAVLLPWLLLATAILGLFAGVRRWARVRNAAGDTRPPE